jgi:Ca-activated chloride channel family protein
MTATLRSLLLLPVLLAVPDARPVADIIVTGRVSDAQSGRGLPLARVTIVGTPAGVPAGTQLTATTGTDGRYVLRVPGTARRGQSARFVASAIGFARSERRVGLSHDSLVVDFALRAEQVRLEGVVVTAPASAGEARDQAAQRKAVTDAASASEQRVVLHAPSSTSPSPSPSPMVQGAAIQGRVARGYSGPPAPMPEYRRAREPHNTEGYAPVDEQPFLAVAANPLSTFGIDVDRASYGNIRRFITAGQRPPRDAVRIEEMVNYFPYALPAPRGEHPFSVTTEAAAAPWQPAHQVVRIGLQGQRIDLRTAPANNLVFLLDVSGSMQSPDKLPLVKASMRLLVNELREQDRVAIVVYAGAAGLVLPSTPGSEKTRILEAIDALEAGGSTAGGAGIQLAYDVAREQHRRNGNNRVVLATDGDFNVGTSSDAELVRLIEQRREQGTFLTVLGLSCWPIAATATTRTWTTWRKRARCWSRRWAARW